MNPLAFRHLVQHLSDYTGPKRNPDGSPSGELGPLALPPSGVLWTLVAPVRSVQDALGRALKMEKAHIGVVMPSSDSKIRAVRGPYAESQVAGGAERMARFYTTVFIRSGREWALDGNFLWLVDWLEESFRRFNDSAGPGGKPLTKYTARLGDVQMMGADGDYLILESLCEMRYLTDSRPGVGLVGRGPGGIGAIGSPSAEGPTLEGVVVEAGLTTTGLANRTHWFTTYLED